jgi:hypothetical protein
MIGRSAATSTGGFLYRAQELELCCGMLAVNRSSAGCCPSATALCKFRHRGFDLASGTANPLECGKPRLFEDALCALMNAGDRGAQGLNLLEQK